MLRGSTPCGLIMWCNAESLAQQYGLLAQSGRAAVLQTVGHRFKPYKVHVIQINQGGYMKTESDLTFNAVTPTTFDLRLDQTFHFNGIQGLTNKQLKKVIEETSQAAASAVNSHLSAINEKMLALMHQQFNSIHSEVTPTAGVKYNGN